MRLSGGGQGGDVPGQVAELDHEGGEVLVGEHDALGRPGGAAGEGEDGEAGEGVDGGPGGEGLGEGWHYTGAACCRRGSRRCR